MPQSIYKRPTSSIETVATETAKAHPTTAMGKGYPVDPLCGVLPIADKVPVSEVPDCLQRRRPGTLYCTGDSSSTVASFACHSSRSLATTANTSLSASLNNDLDRPSKHVSFPDELETLKVENNHELTQEDIKTIWWTIPDFKAFRKFCRKESKRAAEEPGFITDFQYVYEACHSGNLLKQLNWHSEHGTSSASTGKTSVPADTANLSYCISVVDTPYRGLEIAFFKPLLKDRRTAIRTVLAIQDKIPATKSEQEREVILASKSRFLTRKARQMARVLGSADSAAADYIDEQDGLLGNKDASSVC